MSFCDKVEGRENKLASADPKVYSCAQCSERVPSASEMLKHMLERHGIELCKEIKTDTKTEPFIDIQHTYNLPLIPAKKMQGFYPLFHPKSLPMSNPIPYQTMLGHHFLQGFENYQQTTYFKEHKDNLSTGSYDEDVISDDESVDIGIEKPEDLSVKNKSYTLKHRMPFVTEPEANSDDKVSSTSSDMLGNMPLNLLPPM